MTRAHCLVVAKAPVPGEAKTRLAAGLDDDAAADLAAAALLDTLDACLEAFPAGSCHLALAGDLSEARRADDIRAGLAGWRVFAQAGDDFASRLAHAHSRVAGAPVVQVGMDTPQLSGRLLAAAASLLDDHDAVLGPAEDGGWWLLGLRDPRYAEVLRGVPTSTSETGARTRAALRARGVDVVEAATLRDVDEVADAAAVADVAPGSRFAAAWREHAGTRR